MGFGFHFGGIIPSHIDVGPVHVDVPKKIDLGPIHTDIQEDIKATENTIKHATGDVGKFMDDASKVISHLVDAGGKTAEQAVEATTSSISQAIHDLVETGGNIVDTAIETGGDVVETVVDTGGKVVSGGEEMISNIGGSAINTVGGIFSPKNLLLFGVGFLAFIYISQNSKGAVKMAEATGKIGKEVAKSAGKVGEKVVGAVPLAV